MHTPHNTTAPGAAKAGSVPRTPLRFWLAASKPYNKWAFSVILIILVAATADASIVLFVNQFIAAAEAENLQRLIIIGTLFPVAHFLVHSTWRLSGVVGQKWLIGINRESYNLVSEHTLGHGHTYFTNNFAGSLSNKVISVARSMEGLTAHFMWQYLERAVYIVASGVIVFATDVTVGFVYVGLVITLIVINLLLMPRKRNFSYALSKTMTKRAGMTVDIFSNVGAARQYAQLGHERNSIRGVSNEVVKRGTKSFLYSEYMMFVNGLILLMFSVGMFQFLLTDLLSGDLTTASFVTIMVLWFGVSGTLLFLGRIFNETAKMYAEAEEGLELLVQDHEITDAPGATALTVQQGEIRWEGVTFTYGENQVFRDFSLAITPGQRVGLVGPSGAGKTTFVSLLLRQHDLDGGSITIDGQNIAEVTQDSLREAIAVVPQEPMLFHRSIRDNIAYGKPGATDEEVEAVAKKAQAHEFITSLEEGYDTLVGERGVKLSGGQKQRIAIARAMLKDAPILVLDEATSALDSESEVAIQAALHELMEGKTVIAVAHRLSTLREMDRILVLENGQVVEDGSHAELTKQDGTYQRLWEHQAGGFLQE